MDITIVPREQHKMIELTKADYIAKCIIVWVIISSFSLFLIVHQETKESKFFRFGPNDSLCIFGAYIDNYYKYFIVILYTIISTVVRTFQHEVLNPWIIQNIQNDKYKSEYTQKYAYQIVAIDVIYRWFDWFMYMNILLSQVDMMVVEILGNIFTSMYTTHLYLEKASVIPIS